VLVGVAGSGVKVGVTARFGVMVSDGLAEANEPGDGRVGYGVYVGYTVYVGRGVAVATSSAIMTLGRPVTVGLDTLLGAPKNSRAMEAS